MKKTTLCLLLLALALGACRRRAKFPIDPTPPPWLPGVVVKQAQDNVPGFEQLGGFYQAVAYRSGDRSRWEARFEAGSCYYISAAGDQHVREIALYLWSPRDKRLFKDKAVGPKIGVKHCAEASGEYKFEVRIDEGAGHYHAAVFARGPSAPAAPVPAAPPSHGPDPAIAIAEMAASAAPGASPAGTLLSGRAPSQDWFVQMDPDKCYWLIGAGDAAIGQLHLLLWDPREQPITENKSPTSRVTIGHCPKIGGMFKIRAVVAQGAGLYKVGVYAKQK